MEILGIYDRCFGEYYKYNPRYVDTRFQLHIFNALTKAKAESA